MCLAKKKKKYIKFQKIIPTLFKKDPNSLLSILIFPFCLIGRINRDAYLVSMTTQFKIENCKCILDADKNERVGI